MSTKRYLLVLAIYVVMQCERTVCFTSSPRNIAQMSRAFGPSSSMRMDTRIGSTLHNDSLLIESIVANVESKVKHSPGRLTLELDIDPDKAENEHGMPWRESIAGPDAPLIYMPFWEWQLSFMKENLKNLRVLKCSAEGSSSFGTFTEDLSYVENTEKKSRLVNLCFSSSEYRKIRMTYYDAGESCQVFNSVFYPHDDHNLPILGIDILSFNRKKFLAIVDFQPLYQDEDLHDANYEESILHPIREKYKSLNGKMSAKFYDETQFFSGEMLFSRFEKEKIISEELFPAFQEYVSAHLNLVQNTRRNLSMIPTIRERHTAYDTYSAERDPATGLFASMFGKEWAERYVHGFLFSRSEHDTGNLQTPFMTGSRQ